LKPQNANNLPTEIWDTMDYHEVTLFFQINSRPSSKKITIQITKKELLSNNEFCKTKSAFDKKIPKAKANLQNPKRNLNQLN
jgi:hypothetical protein